ncbi:aminopeptidase N [Orrella daihaiensis]|uniref:Aminopeptidase N n=1 Tax=Orrella daihaiensis TaxID=2782176 RepID=A0ABY4AFW9_9BURK|nr:aminopeptidase N [Orrella daihaiensis]UOD49202.1 aminopeptidase N [Orrella daihaiensis]
MTVYRNDYQPFPYHIPTVALQFDLDPEATRVTSLLSVTRRDGVAAHTPLRLDAEDLEFVSVSLNGQPCAPDRFVVDDTSLTVLDLPSSCEIEIVCITQPAQNTSLMGLYVSGHSLFTQCEAEGFRRITYFADRPDVMSTYSVTLRANRSQYPVLLSNGNLVEETNLDDGRHECKWHDPFPKPCYLFALVAGEFDLRQQQTYTRSGKAVTLQIYSDPGTFDRTEWAMQSLERSVRWDESRFGLELDLDRFMIVAARDFNMGAMENKGLNIFNAAYVLADPETATDANYQAIEAVIGHEYFHNWTGNRVTCRDWFQLSLKEGLTVFRDQEFTADMLAEGLDETSAASARAVKRIDDVIMLRAAQFPEDAGPMAHPIRPESFEEISNFYTATVYEKGAEVIRMMHTLLGEQTFQSGMQEYFRRHDGQAVTCDDYVSSLEWALQAEHPNRNLDVFRRWYSQAGTPHVNVELSHGPEDATLTLSQRCEMVGVEKSTGFAKQPFHIPLRIGAIGADGSKRYLSVHAEGEQAVQTGESVLLELTQTQQSWRISGLIKNDILSLNRGFTAPIEIAYEYSNEQLAALAQHDPDAWARWEAMQMLYTRYLLAQTQAADTTQNDTPAIANLLALVIDVCNATLGDSKLDQAYITRLLSLPSDKYLLQQMQPMNPLSLARAKHQLETTLGMNLADQLMECVAQSPVTQQFDASPEAAGKRALRNLALGWLNLANVEQAKSLATHHYDSANNMTDRLGALRALLLSPVRDDRVEAALAHFYDRFQNDPLVVDKWFAIQASAPGTGLKTVSQLLNHPAFVFRNPNRLRALVFQFCSNNPLGFHAPDGSGYRFWAEQVTRIDQSNPEVAARLARMLDHWAHHIEPLKSHMQAALKSVADTPDISGNTREIVTKALTL